uniref:Integrase catalytic domain-containing protein n=1 Tax=Loa loa TaxID=7209 RepID=A0A1I7VCN4_LOALO
MKEQEHIRIGEFLAEKGMVWENITPNAPWSGGLYERLIGLTKRAMSRVTGRKLLWERELMTLIVEIEGAEDRKPREDEAVLIDEPETPRELCKLAKIKELKTGTDGVTRNTLV